MIMTLLEKTIVATCEVEELNKAIIIASSVICSKESPMNTILFEVVEGDTITLRVCGYGAGLSARYLIPLQSACSPFEICIAPKNIKEYLQTVESSYRQRLASAKPEDKKKIKEFERFVTLEIEEGNKLKIIPSCSGGSIVLSGISADEFPAKSSGDVDMDGVRFQMETEHLFPAFSACLNTASSDMTKYTLTTVNMTLEGDCIQLTATDGHRMCRYRIRTSVQTNFNWNIPRKVVETLLKNKSDDEKTVLFFDDPSEIIRIRYGNLIITENLDTGVFPKTSHYFADYDSGKDQDILPGMVAKVGLDKKKLLNIVSRMIIFTAYDKANIIKMAFNFKDNTLTLKTSEKNEKGHGEESMDINATATAGVENLTVWFNISYLCDCLKYLHGYEMYFHLNTGTAPVFCEPALYDEESIFILMPIQPRQF